MRGSRAAFRLMRGFARGIRLGARLARGILLDARLCTRHFARCASLRAAFRLMRGSRAVSIQNVSADEKYIGSGSQSW